MFSREYTVNTYSRCMKSEHRDEGLNEHIEREHCKNLDQRTVRFFLVSLLQDFEESRRNILQIS